MRQQGFTLVELLVAFGLFLLILGGTLALVQTGIRAQASMLEKQAAIEELTFAMDYLSKAFRGARKDLNGDCISAGYTFEVGTVVRWLDRNNQCRELYQQTGQDLVERISQDSSPSFGPARSLISDDFDVHVLWFHEQGSFQGSGGDPDYVQPHITLAVLLRSKRDGQTLFNMQTTLTTRTIDVQQ